MKTVSLVILTFLICFSSTANADTIKPFTSDGCSAFPDGTLTQNNLWFGCCKKHDFAYWQGGTKEQRLASDKALKKCVAKVGKPHIAKLMLTGVRVGGTPYLPTSFRWGYGWSYPRFYGKLSAAEQQQVNGMVKKLKETVISRS